MGGGRCRANTGRAPGTDGGAGVGADGRRVEVAVVGGGIVGLAFAWEAARRGHSVAVFDRTPTPRGASVRNFGMVWPIGQSPGPDHARALRSRERWLELRDRAGVWAAECGSLHAAHADDEDAVLREFADRAPALGTACTYLTPDEAARRFPAVNPDGLRGALHSPAELAVNPPAAVSRLQQYLAEAHGVTLRLGVAVTGIDMPRVHAAGGEVWHAGRVFVCSGADFETLFPEVFAAAGLRRCKLQMMKTRPQPGGWRIGPHLAGGLTLCHYRAFEVCPSVATLRARVEVQMPDYVRYGSHVMASQNDRGEVVIGDSHEYDADISPFDKAEIDDLILGYLRTIARLPDRSVAARWNGVYAKHPTKPIAYAEPQPGCVIAAATGGAGMTLAFGFARDWWDAHPTPPPGLLDRIEKLFAERGGSEYHGEAVSQLEHALQCAHAAERDGCPAEVVAAALLHDVGHLLHDHGEDCAEKGIDNRHEDLGVKLLADTFGPTVTEPVRLHVAAKRYLAAARPGYVGLLSRSAAKSLHFQGGPMSPDEARAFETHPHHAVAVKLREYDDRAKVVGLATPPFAHFRKYLEAAARADA